MPWAPRRPRPWLLVVALLHALLAVGLLQLTRHAPGHRMHLKVNPNVAPLQLVWLRLAAPTPVKQPPAPTVAPRVVPQPAPIKPATAPARVGVEAEPISIPVTAAAAPAAPPPSAASPAPLDLQWRRPTAASAPLAAVTHGDPRLGSPMNRSERFADQVGADQTLTQQTMADGRRLRSGTGCVDVRTSKESQLNAWNQSVSRTPSLAAGCQEDKVHGPSRSRRPPPADNP